MIDPRLLEPICARGWPAAEVAELGGWRLYAADGCSGRINTCWAIEPPGPDDVEAAIDHVEAWYAARGLPPRFKLIEGHDAPIDLAERLARRGYASKTPTLTMAGPLAGEADPDTSLSAEVGDDFIGVFADAAFGQAKDTAERLAALRRMPAPRAFAVLRRGGQPLAVGACVVEGAWAGIIGMRTAPAFRRQGLARRLFRTLTAFARRAGASRAYLQVEAPNAAAIALYQAEGFEAQYLYRYWGR